MTARPGNWALLDHDSDPVSGDPAAVRSEANYYSNMAETIKQEAARLKSLGEDGELVGKYKKSLQEELGDLSDEVGKAHKRYDAVGTALKPYATALDEARTESWGALNDAVTADDALSKANAQPTAKPANGKPLTAAQKTANSSKSTAVTNANDALSRAKTRLSNALGALDTAAKKAVGLINDGKDDSLKDHHHWWDVVVKIVKVLVEIANYVVIVLAIVALFIPGLDVIVLAISLAILAADTLLAATGNGSWLDVAVDVFALATLGAGRGLARAGERGAERAVTGATKAAIKTEFKNSGNIFMRNVFGRGAKMARATEAGTKNVQEFVKAFNQTVKISAKDKFLSGGLDELAKSSKLVESLGGKFGGSVLRNTYMAGVRGAARPVWLAGVGGPLANVGLSESNLPGLQDVKPYSESWEHTKEGVLPNFHVPGVVASEYNWNDHPTAKAVTSNLVYGPAASAMAGLDG